ncbi:MAG: gamma-glutamyl-gamma-aminobutyrate hydrolase family protein [Chloroflexi bacterium]|nr:gamma-glutamyl-gamma-aminobutyrate hydrolase family protein [Chloroflexota bacterium]
MTSKLYPLIGLPTTKFTRPDNGLDYYFSYHRIVSAIVHAGGVPVLIPTDMPDEDTRALYETVDGLLLPGGGDVDPQFYGAERHGATQTPDLSRDVLELKLVRWAVDDDLPLLGICRGNQVVNVALGGTLTQDIPSEVQTPIKHDMPNRPLERVLRAHEVQVQPESHLARILQGTRFPVNSLHHQAIQQPAPGVNVTAHADDGVIEALEVPNKRFAVSVQWHPEDLYLDDSAMQRLFQAFIEAARQQHWERVFGRVDERTA